MAFASSTLFSFPGQQQQPQTQQDSSISEDKIVANTESPTAPGFTPGAANDQSQNRVTMRIGAPIRRSASSSDFEYGSESSSHLASEWFRNPIVFAESSYTTSNDRRRFGIDSDQVAVQAGFDFETKSEFIVGLMYSPTINNGRIEDLGAGAAGGITDVETESHFGTIYIARPINEHFFAGATFSAGTTHTQTELQQSGFVVPTAGVITKTDSEILTVSPSAFVGFNRTFDTYAISTTASYLYSESYWQIEDNSGVRPNPSSFSRSTGTFTWLVQGTYFVTDTLDLSLSHKLTQIVHTNNYLPLGANNGEHDHNWSTIGMDINWILNQSISLYGGVDYDLFNRNYQETITGTFGLSCNF
ncbi:MAG: hypothetical protein AAF571_12940 [Verrucomicrobiota bacterium]